MIDKTGRGFRSKEGGTMTVMVDMDTKTITWLIDDRFVAKESIQEELFETKKVHAFAQTGIKGEKIEFVK